MTPDNFVVLLQQKAAQVKSYANNQFPSTAGNIALRFINGNFRAQGFQGGTFQRWKANKRNGTILVHKGILRSSTYYVSNVGQVTVRNSAPYARAHNEGFKGKVSIPAHTRNSYSKSKVGTGKFTAKGKERMKTVSQKSGETTVKAHTRNMDIKQRQFMPIVPGDAIIMNRAIQREVSKDLFKLFKI